VAAAGSRRDVGRHADGEPEVRRDEPAAVSTNGPIWQSDDWAGDEPESVFTTDVMVDRADEYDVHVPGLTSGDDSVVIDKER